MDYMTILKHRRSIRRFKQTQIQDRFLSEIVDAARRAPSGANRQPLEYIIITDQNIRKSIFPFIKWAGYLNPPWSPSSDERPMAYIAILVMEPHNPYYTRDVGLASAHLIFTAENYSIGSCILCNINTKEISTILKIPNQVLLDSLIALGYKNEVCTMEDNDTKIEYWRDEQQVHHVPKKTFSSIVHYDTYLTSGVKESE